MMTRLIVRETPSQTCRPKSERGTDERNRARSSRRLGAKICENRAADRSCDRDRGGKKEIDSVPTPKDVSYFDHEADRTRL